MSSPTEIEVDGVAFEVYGRALLPLAAPDERISVSRPSALKALRRTGCVMLRYTDHFDDPEPSNFWHVINDQFQPLEERRSTKRRKIRRGLERFRVEQVGLAALLEQAYPVYAAAQANYGKAPDQRDEWREYLSHASGRKEYWLASCRETGRAMAYCSARVFERSCVYSVLKYDPAGLSDYLSYALIYSMDSHYLVERRHDFVSDGERTLSHDSGVHDFLIRELGFRKAYCRLNVIFSPAARLMAALGAIALRWKVPVPASLALLAVHRMLAAEIS